MADRLRVGVIGAGIWGRHHAHVFATLPQCELAAVCDVDAGRAEEMQAAFDAPRAVTDYAELLADPAIDAVSIATPDFSHTPIILDAIAAQKHILSEKPLATTVEESDRIAEAAKGCDRVIMVDFHNRVGPVFVGAREDIAEGRLGKPIHGAARLSNTTFVPLEMLSWAGRSSALWFLGSHLVDLLRFVLDDDVVRVFAVASRGVLQARGVDTDDVHLAILEFAGGAKITIENSWVLSPDNPQIFDFHVRLVGEQGQLSLSPSHNDAYVGLYGEGQRYRDLMGLAPSGIGRVSGYVHESIARFVDAVRDGRPVVAGVADGVAVTRVLAAIEESAKSGNPVDVSAS